MAAWIRAGQRLVPSAVRVGTARARRWWLVALCAALNVFEAALVAAYGHGSHPALAPQASAVAPFGVFGDLRWVSVYHNSWPALVGELAGTVVVRGLLTALSIGLAWPAGAPRPAGTALARRGILGTALAALLLVPSVVLLFGTAVAPVSWLFLAAVPTAVLVAVLVHPAVVSGDWWRRVVSARAVGWVAASFLALNLASAAMAALPSATWPAIALASGLFNAWSWTGVVHAVVGRRPVRHHIPVAGVSALVLSAVVVGGTVIGFDMARNQRAGAVGAEREAPARRGAGLAVLVVSGYGSSWDGRAAPVIPGPFVEERFSYRGLSAAGTPLPYTSADTAKGLPQLERMLLRQINALRDRSGQRIAVVAESEGSLVAKTALLARDDPGVRFLVMASPLESPGRVSYPTTGDAGWGVASNTAMRLISDAFQGVAPIDLSPDNMFLASLDHEAPELENAMSCPLAGVRQFALLPLADATVTPAAYKLPFPSVVLAAFHGGLLETAAGEKMVADVLEGRPVAEDRLLVLADDAIRDAASGWQVPPLVASDYPGSGRTSSLSCSEDARRLRAEIVQVSGRVNGRSTSAPGRAGPERGGLGHAGWPPVGHGPARAGLGRAAIRPR
jgi:hypothetical protein